MFYLLLLLQAVFCHIGVADDVGRSLESLQEEPAVAECPGPSRRPRSLMQVGTRAQRLSEVVQHNETALGSALHGLGLTMIKQDCLGHFTAWSSCNSVCERWHTWVVDQPMLHGGADCEHTNGHIMKDPCIGGLCPLKELPPAGSMPSSDKAVHVVHTIAFQLQLPFFLCVMMALGVGEVLHKIPLLKALPESFLVVVISGLFGLSLRLLSHADRWETEDVRPVSATTMNLVLLPIIIFHSGWSVPLKHMFGNFGYILVFAVAGTLLSTAAITGFILGTAQLGLHVISDPRTAVATAVLMSATDPVATLATFAKKKVEPTLNILVFGESIINDAVAVVLFNLVNMDEPTELFSHEWHQLVMSTVVELLLGSIAIGFGLSLILVMFFRLIHQFGHLHSTFKSIYVLSSAYLVNAVAESAHHSGIIACLFAGITLSIYLRPHLGEQDYARAGQHLHVLAEFADLTVFIMVGVTTALLKSTKGLAFGVWLFFFAVAGRAFSVFPCALLCNTSRWCTGQEKLCTWRSSTMMWHAGLRGGIALTLVMQLNDWAQEKTALVTATFLVITLLLVVMGGTTDLMLGALGIEMGVEEEAVKYSDLQAASTKSSSDDTMVLRVAKLTHRCLHTVLVGDAAAKAGDSGDH